MDKFEENIDDADAGRATGSCFIPVAFSEPDESTLSEDAYGSRMVEAWKDGILFENEHKFDVWLNVKVFRDDNSEVGDVDLQVAVKGCGEELVTCLFPPGSCKFSPPLDISAKFAYVFAEVKRSCHVNYADEKLNQFVRFYDYHLRALQSANPQKHPILFVYNGGTDCTSLANKLKAKLNNSFHLHGHPVYIVYVHSELLITWVKDKVIEAAELRLIQEREAATRERRAEEWRQSRLHEAATREREVAEMRLKHQLEATELLLKQERRANEEMNKMLESLGLTTK